MKFNRKLFCNKRNKYIKNLPPVCGVDHQMCFEKFYYRSCEKGSASSSSVMTTLIFHNPRMLQPASGALIKSFECKTLQFFKQLCVPESGYNVIVRKMWNFSLNQKQKCSAKVKVMYCESHDRSHQRFLSFPFKSNWNQLLLH